VPDVELLDLRDPEDGTMLRTSSRVREDLEPMTRRTPPPPDLRQLCRLLPPANASQNVPV